MDDILRAEIKLLLSTGKDCNLLQVYKKYYKIITNTDYRGGCNSCACTWLYRFLTQVVK